MELLSDIRQVEARFGLLGKGVNLGTKYMICSECTTGMEIFLAAHDGPPR
jgi:hypothetical protein